MAYTKVIQSGTMLEEWVYEREPAVLRPGKKRKSRVRRVFRQERRADSIVRCRNSFRRLVRANLDGISHPALLTLNTKALVGVEEGYKRLNIFCTRMRQEFSKDIKWIAVPEFQKRGAVHFHILIWGLPNELPCIFSKEYYINKIGKKKRKHVCPETRQCERKQRRIASLWKVGFADIILTDGNEKLSTYLAKYMSKAMHDKRLLGKRAYSATRNVMRPVSFNTPYQISSLKGVLEIENDEALVKYREYDTIYLGRCIYKQSKVDLVHGNSNYVES